MLLRASLRLAAVRPRAITLTRARLLARPNVQVLASSYTSKATQSNTSTSRPPSSVRMVASSTSAAQFQATSGGTDAVWILHDQYTNRPGTDKKPLTEDTDAEVCIVGSGIAGVSLAHELIMRGKQVVLLEARDFVSGETGRTSGHLSSALDDGYVAIAGKHGKEGARAAADSHTWALNRVGEVSTMLGIDCEYRKLPGYMISQYPRSDEKNHAKDIGEIKDEVAAAQEAGLEVEFKEGLTIKGWAEGAGHPDQRDGAIWHGQATFHPTKYIAGVLQWLFKQPGFRAYPHTRVVSVEESGIEILGLGSKHVTVTTEAGHTVSCAHAVEATNVPLQKLSVVAQMEFERTYCIAIRVPKRSLEDCLIYDTAEAYKYTRLTACDDKDDYLVVGGCDHKVGQEPPEGRFEELESWVRERFPQAGEVDYRWSGQVFEPADYVAYIGLNQGCKRTYIVTGDSGNGLTHGVIAGKLLADEIEGVANSWATLYNPKRVWSTLKSAASIVANDLQVNAQYKRFLESDIKDIEDLGRGCGGVLNPTTGKPVAVYKDENGKVTQRSAICPHLKGVVCWNPVEKSWDCPIHGSRFSTEGVCVEGPAKANLAPVEA